MKKIELEVFRRLKSLRIPSQNEVLLRRADEKQRKRNEVIEAAVRASFVEIRAMRDAGESFYNIQRVFARNRIDISVPELRSTFLSLLNTAAGSCTVQQTDRLTGQRT